MKELSEVLSKWNKGTSVYTAKTSYPDHDLFKLTLQLAIYIPPKQDQAFNQGGTFLFDGETTIFAHYDQSTGAHSDINKVINMAKQRVAIPR